MAKADPNCSECYGQGTVFIPAHQSNGNIVDEREIPCGCTKEHND